MAVVSAADIDGPPYPDAHDVIPTSYRSLAGFANRGGVVEAIGAEREAVMSLMVTPLHLTLRESVVEYLRLRASVSSDVDKSVKEEAYRMASVIFDRVKRGGEASVRINPLRTAPNISELVALIIRKWQECEGKCGLCGGQLIAGTRNSMLQISADRIDSSNGAYDDSNVHLTHLACNLAKNKYGLEEFEDWIAVLRGVSRLNDVA
jgi:hypothetical protein